MTSAVTLEEDRGQEQQAQPPAFEGKDLEAVRAYMRQLLTEGRGEQAIEMLLGLLGRLREEHSSTLVRLQQALRQLYGRRSEATRLYDMLRGRGYEGSVRTVREYVAGVRPRPTREAFLRVEPLPGEQSQVDWAYVGKVKVPGGERALWLFVQVLAGL